VQVLGGDWCHCRHTRWSPLVGQNCEPPWLQVRQEDDAPGTRSPSGGSSPRHGGSFYHKSGRESTGKQEKPGDCWGCGERIVVVLKPGLGSGRKQGSAECCWGEAEVDSFLGKNWRMTCE
jgi:hypothetical protein